MISLARVRAMLELFPLDGLRKAAEKVDSPDVTIPKRETSTMKQHQELVDAFMTALERDTLGNRATLSRSPDDMWNECYNSGIPVEVVGPDVPVLNTDLKKQIHEKVMTYIKPFHKCNIQKICAGKVSAATRNAEQSAYKKRWRDRYGKKEHDYTYMRRIYRDKTTSHDYKAREQVALSIEQYVFEILREYLGIGDDAGTIIGFSDEPGRTLKSNVDRNPEWGMFVYLAIKY